LSPSEDLLLGAKHLLVEAIALKSHHDRARAAIQRILACLRGGGRVGKNCTGRDRGAPAVAAAFSCTGLRENGKSRHIPGVEEIFFDVGRTPVDQKRRKALRAQEDDVADRLNEFGSGRPDRVAGVAKRRPVRPQGNSRACILRRLRRDHVELYRLVLSGEISPHRAAIQAGFRKPPGRRPKHRPIDPLEITREQEMELWLGASHNGSVFGSEDERREAWIRHRERLMAMWGTNGRRPLAWWCFEAPDDLDYEYATETSTLYEAGLLTESEQAELVERWRHEFDRACAPNFSHCLGPARFLTGAEGREAHYRWADIPATLVEQWEAERRQRDTKTEPHGMATEGLESA
jgi:hypothetical protein